MRTQYSDRAFHTTEDITIVASQPALSIKTSSKKFEKLSKQLFSAAQYGDHNDIIDVLDQASPSFEKENIPFINQTNTQGHTALIVAAIHGNKNAIYPLLHHSEPHHNIQACIAAVNTGHLEILEILFAHQPQLKTQTNSLFALAVQCKQFAIAEYLLTCNISISKPCYTTKTAIIKYLTPLEFIRYTLMEERNQLSPDQSALHALYKLCEKIQIMGAKSIITQNRIIRLLNILIPLNASTTQYTQIKDLITACKTPQTFDNRAIQAQIISLIMRTCTTVQTNNNSFLNSILTFGHHNTTRNLRLIELWIHIYCPDYQIETDAFTNEQEYLDNFNAIQLTLSMPPSEDDLELEFNLQHSPN